jgi:hypothetical protein
MLCLLTTISFASNSMTLDDTPDRIQSILASIFTVLSLRFSLNENMANVNYMTALDVCVPPYPEPNPNPNPNPT